MRYLLTAERFDADTALRAGLVTEEVPEGRHLERGVELARLITASAPLEWNRTVLGSPDCHAQTADLEARAGVAAWLRGWLRHPPSQQDWRCHTAPKP